MSATLERLGAGAGQATRFVKLLGNQRPALRPALRVPDGQTLTGAIVHPPRSSCKEHSPEIAAAGMLSLGAALREDRLRVWSVPEYHSGSSSGEVSTFPLPAGLELGSPSSGDLAPNPRDER